MEEIVRFLLEHPPFSQLPLLQIQRIAGAIQIEYFGQGVQILVQGGKPAAFLYIVRRGSVDLLRERDGVVELTDTMSEGECFGYVSLIQGKPPISTVRAREATSVTSFLLGCSISCAAITRHSPSFLRVRSPSDSNRRCSSATPPLRLSCSRRGSRT